MKYFRLLQNTERKFEVLTMAGAKVSGELARRLEFYRLLILQY
jgi:hypothetical protein